MPVSNPRCGRWPCGRHVPRPGSGCRSGVFSPGTGTRLAPGCRERGAHATGERKLQKDSRSQTTGSAGLQELEGLRSQSREVCKV